ncbi:hypothetical protein [Dysgonomonas sp. ZJ709]|uniref:hypothetical protein n=1 Tax=Dysgonomonas sp. ZJ709 TaxID=2709797 RepID=UPI0013EC521E|nr:hypothetical protein [Dysgonomonas sp. ZJ709]
MNKGDIIWARDREKHPHPIVFLKQERNGTFSACIITHEQGNGNIRMEDEHFCKVDENNNPYSIKYENTFLVHRRLSKENSWITNETVKGRLTEVGIRYVESMIPTNTESHPDAVWNWNED